MLAASVAVAGGAAIALGKPIVAAALLVLAWIPVWLHAHVLLYVSLLTSLVFTGVTMLYFPQFQYVRWLVPLTALILLLQMLLAGRTADTRRSSALVMWALAFCAAVVLSSALSWQGLAQTMVGLKTYLQVWPLFFALAWMAWDRKWIASLPKFAWWLALLQLPFVAHQFFVLAPMRAHLGGGVVPLDIVAGTFGANEFGGGKNSVLSIFLFVVFATIVSRWKAKLIRPFPALLASTAVLLPVFINESKVSVLFLGVVLFSIFATDIVRRPLAGLTAFAAGAAVIGAMIFSYAHLHPSDKVQSGTDLVEHTVEQNFSEGAGYGGSSLNRWTSIEFWWSEHRHRDLTQMLIGHGPRASRDGGDGMDQGQTLASQQYVGYGIGLTAVSSLLWEMGVLGLALTAGMLWSAYIAATRSMRSDKANIEERALLRGLRAAVLVLGIGLLHKSSFVFDVSYQTIFVTVLGLIAYYQKHFLAE